MALNVPPTWRDQVEHRRKIASTLNGVIDGRTNNIGAVTLGQPGTTTVVNDKRAGVDSVVLLMPTTATAAGLLTQIYVSSRGKETFTITHPEIEDSDADFEYALCGTGSSQD